MSQQNYRTELEEATATIDRLKRAGSQGAPVNLIFRLILALTSALFFAEYGGAFLEGFLDPETARLFAAVIGVVIVDGAIWHWQSRETDADTIEQQRIASVSYGVNFGLSVATTIIYAILNNPLWRPAAETVALVSFIGAWVIPFAITFNGAQAIRFTRNSQRRLIQKEQIDLALEQSVVDNELARLQQQQILAREMAKAKELIPDYTEREATRRVSIRYGILSENGHKAARPTERP